MKKKIKILSLLLSALFAFTSCEQVIDLDLNETGQRIVIEGAVTLTSNPCIVKISTSGDFYTGEGVNVIDDANVEVFSSNGEHETLVNAGSGIYFTPELIPIPQTEYTVKVTYNDVTYTAADTLPEMVYIENLDYNLSDFSNEGPNDDGYDVHYDVNCSFQDEPGVKNYYLLRLFRNDESVDGRRGKYFLLSDEYLDGEKITYTFFGIGAEINDTINVSLSSVGPATYDYYRTLNDALSQGGMGSTPYNPITNFDNDALGYFGTFTLDQKEISILGE
jgi:hypothetical protein